MRGIRRVGVTVCGLGLAVGCGSSGSGSPSAPNPAAPTVSNLTVSPGPDVSLVFQMSATDVQGDIVGGTCNLTTSDFNGTGVITGGPGVPPSATAVTVVCTVAVEPGFTGTVIAGTISVTDAAGNTSNILSFTTALPERTRGSS